MVTLGRRLDFQLAYGSPAVFGEAQFLRIADCASELRDNRRGAVEMFATPALALTRSSQPPGAARRRPIATGRSGCAQSTSSAPAKLRASMRDAPPGSDGRMHPNRLLAALRERCRPMP